MERKTYLTAKDVLNHHLSQIEQDNEIGYAPVSTIIFGPEEKIEFNDAYWKFVTDYVKDPENGIDGDVSLLNSLELLSCRLGEQKKLQHILELSKEKRSSDSASTIDALRNVVLKSDSSTSYLEAVAALSKAIDIHKNNYSLSLTFLASHRDEQRGKLDKTIEKIDSNKTRIVKKTTKQSKTLRKIPSERKKTVKKPVKKNINKNVKKASRR